MKVGSAAQIVQVQVRKLQIQGGAEISENLALFAKRKDYGDTGGLVWKCSDSRNIDDAV